MEASHKRSSISAMKLALEALESDPLSHAGLVSRKQAIAALRQALETEQEPVAWMHTFIEGNVITHIPADIGRHPERWTPLYTSPPKREWVGLTADEIWECNKASGSAVEFHICYAHQNVEDFAESIEAKLKEKNA
jgi:hypothetical protein